MSTTVRSTTTTSTRTVTADGTIEETTTTTTTTVTIDVGEQTETALDGQEEWASRGKALKVTIFFYPVSLPPPLRSSLN